MRYLSLLLLLTLLAGCWPAPSPTPEPTLLLKIRIYDQVTGEKLEGNVFWSPLPVWMGVQGEDLMGLGIHGIDLPLGSEANGWIAVAVPGYQLNRLRVNYWIDASRELEVPMWMQREIKGEQL